MSSEASPFANGCEAPQARNRFRDTPNLLTIKYKYTFHNNS